MAELSKRLSRTGLEILGLEQRMAIEGGCYPTVCRYVVLCSRRVRDFER